MNTMNKKEKIILASKSPRRIELLKKIIENFEVYPSDVDEEKITEKDPVKFAVLAAIEKAKAVGEKFPGALVIGADTIVVYENKIYGKPKNHDEAREMLKTLSGRSHQVITGIAIYNAGTRRKIAGYEITEVVFKALANEEIENYLVNYEVLDKAGSYAIQDIEEAFIEKINGDYDNVVGLPVEKLRQMLESF